MISLASIKTPVLDTMTTEIVPPNRIVLKGTITLAEPSKALAGFFRSVHNAAVEMKLDELKLDVSGLTFVNSSTIRLFIDWATWLKAERGHQYRFRLLANRNVTWQKTSFKAISSLIKDVLVVEYAI
jgi:hypothetical protein